MPDGFGGDLAAPIWHDYMLRASQGYCADFSRPTTPFSGTAFSGPHSSARSPSPSTGPQSGPGALNNPQLYSQPPAKTNPQPAPTPTIQSGGGGVAPPGSGGGGHGGGGGGGGGGHGGGGGGHG